MSLGRIEHNIMAVLELLMGVEENLSMLYSRLRFLSKDPRHKMIFGYLSMETLSHRIFLEELLEHNLDKYKTSLEEFKDVIEVLGRSFRDVRDLYIRSFETYELRQLIETAMKLENIIKDLLATYSVLQEFHKDDEEVVKILNLLTEDSSRHLDILRSFVSNSK